MDSVFSTLSRFSTGTFGTSGVIAVLALIAAAGVALVILRARKTVKLSSPCCTAEPEPEEKAEAPRSRLARLWDAIDYLRTRREWRYATPWILLIGETGSGKSSLIASASAEHRQAVVPRRDELKVDGTEWQIFDQGVLIDPEGGLQEKEWTRVLREVEALRPERALDGLLLTVSARSLLNAGAEQRLALAETAYRRLCEIQQSFEFALPVYVVLTECDAVDGFAAFWDALPGERRREIFGWSMPSHLASADSSSWTDQAFETLAGQLQTLQLDAAARSEQIADADCFVLFPRHFQRLREPVRQWLATVFQASGWHAGFLFRGMYFTGSIAADGSRTEGVRKDVAFVDDLIAKKVLAEHHLALPTRQGIWSRNRLIRKVQRAGIALACGLLVALAVAGFRLERQVDAVIAALDMLQQVPASAQPGQACIGQDQVYPLLTQVARIDADARYWAIPVSWIDARVSRRSAALVANATFQRVVMPSLACQLELRARRMVAFQPEALPERIDDAYAQSRQNLFGFMQSAQDLELNLTRFRQLARQSRQPEIDDPMAVFTALAAYAYDAPLPKAVEHERGALSGALEQVHYGSGPQLPAGMQQRFLNQVTAMSASLRSELEREVGIGAPLLAQLDRGEEPLLRTTRHFTRWLAWTRESWLGSTERNNPCEENRVRLNALATPMVQQYRYPARLLELGARFDTVQCYKPAMKTLTAMQLPPYGALFKVIDGALDLNPKLQPELNGLKALAQLDFMQIENTRQFTCQTTSAGWRAADIVQAGNYLRGYADFVRKQSLPTSDSDGTSRPLFDRLARIQLERVLDSTMRSAQAQDPAAQTIQQVSLQATSLADQELAQQSANFNETLEPLLNVLLLQRQNGLDAGAMRITQCIRDYAADTLGRADALVAVSRLYDPSDDSDETGFFNLGTTPVTLDYLTRQISRSQVLAGYATPFVNFLQKTDAVNDAQRTNAQTAPYWNNTISELNRYVQFKETAGQVVHLHDLFLKQFPALDESNCEEALSAYQSPAYGNDLFSQRRLDLEEQAEWRCTDGRTAQVYEAWRDLSSSFNRDLANRYPFADAGARDADPGAVKAFFIGYAAQRDALRKSLAGLSGPQWDKARRFLDQLDAVNAFFSANLTAGSISQPVKLDVVFRAQADDSPGSNQLLAWALTSAGRTAGFPNRPTTLNWSYGQPLVLDLTWADRSLWRPAADPQQADLQVSGATASFAVSGRWALLRMIDRHRATGSTDALSPGQQLLSFNVPVAPADNQPGKTVMDTARLYVSLQLMGTDPKTQAPVPLTLPSSFPRSIPSIQE